MQRAILLLLLSSCLPPAGAAAQRAAAHRVYDLVILHGRVMDPESGLDAPRNLGIRAGRIARLTAGSIAGLDTIDAAGLVVAPGFIDLHQHAQTPEGYRVEALDGTTTALELELGTADVAGWYAARAGGAPINYGVSVGHTPVRMRVMGDTAGSIPAADAAHRAATAAELAEIRRRIDAGLDDGAVAVGVLLLYTPAATPWEVLEAFRAAAAHGASVHIHVRDVEEPQYFLETEEALGASAITGAPVQIVHIQSSMQKDTPRALELIRAARAHGLDATTECYPYDASMVEIQSVGGERWRERPDAWFARIEWPATGERLTRESFPRFRALGGEVVVHNNTEEVVRGAVADSLTMIASDGILHDGIGHPRVAGTFARVLGRYVRETHALGLMDALRKMTLLPARRLEARVPAMRGKGRVREGADADLVLFDPRTVADRATYREPTLPPAGIPFVLVGGVPVVRDGRFRDGVLPGRPIRAPVTRSGAN